MPEHDHCGRAARLLYKGLQPRLHPQQDSEYQQLVQAWQADADLRAALERLAEGMELAVVDLSDQGLVLAPVDHHSRFAMTLTDYRQSLGGDTQRLNRGFIALVQVAIAAALFPTADKLDDLDQNDDESIRERDIREVLLSLCQRLQQARDGDPESLPERLRAGWEAVLQMPPTLPEGQRASLGSLDGVIRLVLGHLEDQKLMQSLGARGEEQWFPNRRYQLLLQRRAAGGLFAMCHQFATVGVGEVGEVGEPAGREDGGESNPGTTGAIP